MNEKRIRLESVGTSVKKVLTAAGLIAIFLFSLRGLDVDFGKFIERLANVGPVLRRMAALNFAVLPDIMAGQGACLTKGAFLYTSLSGGSHRYSSAGSVTVNVEPFPRCV